RRRAVQLYVTLASAAFVMLLIGVAAEALPGRCLAVLLALPWLLKSARQAAHTYESPARFVPAIRSIVSCYALAVALLCLTLFLNAWSPSPL
ncbi:MAG TPA: hypothetical protein VI653_06890, partial [Steroidobacteraceae bacterium]